MNLPMRITGPESALYSSPEPFTLNGVAEPWPEPLPLPSGLPAVQPFDINLLPQAFRPWVADIAERMQAPPDFTAVAAMVAAGALIGRKCAIRPKRQDSWQCVPNLFGMSIGRPSLMKTQTAQEGIKALQRLEIEAKEEFEQEKAEYEAALLLSDAQRKAKGAELKTRVKEGGDGTALAAELASMNANNLPPTRRRYVTNDPTVEKLGELLRENENGLLLYSDELIGLLRNMEKDGRESDRAFFLTAWNGTERHTSDRLGRGTIDVKAAIVSILGNIQPGVLSGYIQDAVAGGKGADGLLQRFQLSVWPDPPKHWKNVDRYPDNNAKAIAYAAFQQLDKLTADQALAHKDELDKDALPFLRFDEDAQPLFNEWRKILEQRIRGDEHPAFESHLAKYRSLIPSLALICHLVDGKSGPIGVDAIAKAIAWGDYLESHARRIYASVTEGPAIAARELARRIKAGDVVDMFTARDVYRMEWHGLKREAAENAIETLTDLRWIERREVPTPGRLKICYAINPKIKSSIPKALTQLTQGASVSSVGELPEDDRDFSLDDFDGREGA